MSYDIDAAIADLKSGVGEELVTDRLAATEAFSKFSREQLLASVKVQKAKLVPDPPPPAPETQPVDVIDFIDRELARLHRRFMGERSWQGEGTRRVNDGLPTVRNLWNSKDVFCLPYEWAEALAEGALRIAVEEENMESQYKIGTRVRRKDLKYNGVVVQYGVVVANPFLYRTETNPFRETTEALERIKPLATIPFISWRDKDDNEICLGWSTEDLLEAV